MRTHTRFAAVALALVLAAGCGSAAPTSPALGLQALQGTWSSTTTTSGSSVCTSFKWTVTEMTSNSASGTFTATCLGVMNVSGTASGTLSGQTITWTASGAGTSNGAACPFALTGTATLENNGQVRVPYLGSTCLGPVSGVEILKK